MGSTANMFLLQSLVALTITVIQVVINRMLARSIREQRYETRLLRKRVAQLEKEVDECRA